MASHRWAKAPALTTITRSPADSVFATAASMAPVPVHAGVSTSSRVCTRRLRASRTSRKRATYSAARWWMIGRVMASSTSLGTGVGPGAISWYFFITRLLPQFECAPVRLAEARRPRQCGGIITAMSTRTVRTMCPMNCHPTYCGMLVEVSDQGRLLAVRGDPDNPDSRGFLCIRGRAAVELPHNERRLLTPLLREGRRGEDRWRSISWEEALDRIVAAIGRTGRERVGFWFGHGAHVTGINRPLIMRFGHLGGMQVWNPAIVCWAMGAYGLALTGVIETNTKEDMAEHSRLVILWGANLASQPTTAPHLDEARRRGARVIAIAHVIVAEGFVDGNFIARHTIGFEKYAEHLKRFTPEWAAAETGLAAADILRLAREYVPTRPSMIVVGGASMYKHRHGWEPGRAVATLPA